MKAPKPTLQLREYQADAADFLYAHDYALLLARVGAGKTGTALTAMSDMLRDGHAKRFLVIAPKRVCTTVWPQEALLWAPHLRVVVLAGQDAATREALLEAEADIVVCNIDLVQWLCEQPFEFDGLVIDELSKFKTAAATKKKETTKGKRFKALEDRIGEFKYRWGMTGTFTSEGLEDIYGQCRIINPHILPRSKSAFLKKYFIPVNPRFGEWLPRSVSYKQVMDLVRPHAYILESKEYDNLLPPITYVNIPVELPPEAREAYNKMKNQLATEIAGAKITALTAATAVQKLAEIASGFCYDSWKEPHPDKPGEWINYREPHRISDHKLDALEDLLDENQHAPTLLFYIFDEERRMLLERFKYAVELSDKAIDEFNAGRIPLLIAHPKSAAHGLNLYHASHLVVWFSLTYSRDEYDQGNGRVHRGGQKHEVTVYHLLGTKTVDTKILDTLADKLTLSELAMEELTCR